MLFAQWGRNLAPLAANLERFAQDLQMNSTPIAPGSTTPSEILDLTDTLWVTLRHHMRRHSAPRPPSSGLG